MLGNCTIIVLISYAAVVKKWKWVLLILLLSNGSRPPSAARDIFSCWLHLPELSSTTNSETIWHRSSFPLFKNQTSICYMAINDFKQYLKYIVVEKSSRVRTPEGSFNPIGAKVALCLPQMIWWYFCSNVKRMNFIEGYFFSSNPRGNCGGGHSLSLSLSLSLSVEKSWGPEVGKAI